MQYWLFKSEPNTFNIDDLIRCPKQTTYWDGIRNYQARNMLRDEIKVGDQVFFYHSNCDVPGIVGIMEVVKEGYPDDSAHNPESRYFDSKSSPVKPIWYRVDVKFLKKFDHCISLNELKQKPNLKNMKILQKGNRLSITKVSAEDWLFICHAMT